MLKKKKIENDCNAVDWCKISIKIVMWKFLRGRANVIPGGTSIPESRVASTNVFISGFCQSYIYQVL
jgi:hypothetical protein